MTKLEFMQELESLLSDIPLEEREEALQYYNGYFEDAGEDHEEEIMNELGSPKRVAAIIKADLNANAEDRENRGYFTENGYQDTAYNDEKYEIIGSGKKNSDNKQEESTGNTNNANANSSSSNNRYGNNNGYGPNNGYSSNNGYNGGRGNNANAGSTNYSKGTNNSNYRYGAGQGTQYNQEAAQDAGKKEQERTRNTNIGLIILICFVGSPFIMAALSTLFGIVMAIIGIIFGFGVAGLALMATGVFLFIAGITQLAVPFTGLLFCGSGLIVLGLGMLFALACVLLCKNVLPAIVKGVINLCRRPFQNRSVTA